MDYPDRNHNQYYLHQNQQQIHQQQGYQQEEQYVNDEEYEIELEIPTKNEPNMLIDYADDTVAHYLLYKKIEQEPQSYFNFGFDLKDYAAFMLKQTFMRAERKVIEEIIQKDFKGNQDTQQQQ